MHQRAPTPAPWQTLKLTAGFLVGGEAWANQTVTAPFPSMPGQKMLAFNGELVLATSSTHLRSICTPSTRCSATCGPRPDVRDWTWENQQAFLPRFGHSGYVIGGRMFVFGGYNDLTQLLGDIHSSANGVSWREDVATSTNIGKRAYQETVLFNNRVWLLGGQTGGWGRERGDLVLH